MPCASNPSIISVYPSSFTEPGLRPRLSGFRWKPLFFHLLSLLRDTPVRLWISARLTCPSGPLVSSRAFAKISSRSVSMTILKISYSTQAFCGCLCYRSFLSICESALVLRRWPYYNGRFVALISRPWLAFSSRPQHSNQGFKLVLIV